MKRIILAVFICMALFSTTVYARELSTSKSAEVNARASEVWELLIKADHWADWNPAVKSSKLIEGDGEAVGSRVKFVPIIGDKRAPMPIKLTVAKSEKPGKLEYTAKAAGTNILFGFSVEDVEGKEELVKVTSYETIKGKASGLFAAIFSQEGLDKEHEVWVESIKKKLEHKGCGCDEK